MDFSILLSTIQLTIAAFQLKFDHFKKSANRPNQESINAFYSLGEAIRVLEYALAETVAFVGQGDAREPNPQLAQLWENASNSIRNVADTADLTDITFEKNLYWRNPGRYQDQDAFKLYRISLDNVLVQLRQLRSKYDQLQKKVIEQE